MIVAASNDLDISAFEEEQRLREMDELLFNPEDEEYFFDFRSSDIDWNDNSAD